MKDKSNMSLIGFITEGIIFMFITMITYKNAFFRCLNDLSYNESSALLWIILVAFVLLHGILIFKYHRTGGTVAISLLLPYGIYTILAYKETIGIQIKVVLGVSFLLALLYIFLVMFRKIKNQEKKAQIYKNRAYRCLIMTYKFVGIGMAVIMLPLLLQSAFGVVLFKPSVKPALQDTVSESTIQNNIDTILLLQEQEWQKLTTKEKLDVMQVVANIEANYLGIPHELNVGGTNLDEVLAAAYSDSTHSIQFNMNYLETSSAKRILESCCHEAHHAYQYCLIDAYDKASEEAKNLRIYKEAKVYKKEFDHYISADKDADAYMTQQCEKDARSYAESAVEDYYNRIYEHLGIDNPDEETDTDSKIPKRPAAYDENKNMYLTDDSGERISEIYKKIYDEDLKSNEICRYIGENGLFGYLLADGTQLTEPVYTEASAFQDERAKVKEATTGIYYINEEGKRCTEEYADGFDFEHQGSCARVQLADGTWGIIERSGEQVFEGADFIHPLPDVFVIGSCIMDGKAVLFEIDQTHEIKIIKKFEEFTTIKEPCGGTFAIVGTEDGKYGVVNWQGELIIPAEYLSIEYEIRMKAYTGLQKDEVEFLCRKSDGSYQIILKEW